jgi:hypothetical protein
MRRRISFKSTNLIGSFQDDVENDSARETVGLAFSTARRWLLAGDLLFDRN